MTDTSLRDVLARLVREPGEQEAFARDPSAYLSGHGHDLPDDLVAEAISNVAAGLPAESAEHLAPFTVADSPIPPVEEGTADAVDAVEGLRLLASVPPLDIAEHPTEGADLSPNAPADDADVDFGSGAGGEPVEADEFDADADPGFLDDMAPSGDLGSVEMALDETADLVDDTLLDAVDLELELEPDPIDNGPDPAELDGLD